MSKANRASKLQIKSPLELAARGLARHWIYLLLAILIAAGAGFLAVKQFGKKRYSYQGKLFYSPNRVTEPYYVSPSLRDLQLAIVETPFLKSLQEEFDVDEDFLVFAYRIGFDVNGSSSLDVSYTGRDPDKVQELVQGSMQRFVDRAKELRQSSLEGYVRDFGQNIIDAEEHYEETQSKFAEKIQSLGMQSDESLTTEIDRLRQAITSYESSLEDAKMRRDLSDSQIEFLAQMKQEPVEDNGDDVATSSDPQKNDDDQRSGNSRQSLATYDTQMQKLLEDRIRREREDSSLQLSIDLKQKEFERSQSSFARDLISEAAFEKVRGELQLLEAQKSSRIQELESQLSQINGRINDRTESLSVLDPVTAAALMPGGVGGNLNLEAQTLALLKGSSTAAEMNIQQLTESIDEAKKKLSTLTEIRQEAAPLISNVELAASEVSEVRHIRDQFARAQHSDQAELSIAQDATRLLEGEKNNYMKWFLAAAMATGGLLVGPLFGYEFLKALREAPESASVFGLPVLARKPPQKMFAKQPEQAAESMQRVSLRIAQSYGRNDGVLALAGGQSGDENDDVVKSVADHYRRSGVTVSIADAADLVAGRDTSAIAGSWVNESKQGRGLTLIRSPLMASPLAGDTAAANSDAMVILTSAKHSSSPAMQRRIAELNDLGTRVIGAVLDR